MLDIILSIANLFGKCSHGSLNLRETLQQFECSCSFNLTETPATETLLHALPHISERDTWRLGLLNDNGDYLFDLRPGGDVGEDYNADSLQPYKDDIVRLIFTVDKTKKDNVLTVYDHEVLLEYVRDLYVTQFISVLGGYLGENLVLEIWSEEYERFSTSSITVLKNGDEIQHLQGNSNKRVRTNECKQHCQWNNNLSDLLPEDVLITQRDKSGELAKLFDQMCLLLSAIYVADFSSVDRNGIKLRMSGFKMMVTEEPSSKLSSLSFDAGSAEQWYMIYDWCYTGGYTADRLSIARNLITLNSPNANKLSLNASTYDAIRSNFKIFEKDNVRQYIKVRNEVSKTLLDLQERVNSIVESFTGDFRKSVVGLGTFFLTLVVVRVVGNGNWTGVFTTQIVALSFIFILLSAVILYYSRQAMDKKEKLFNKQYQQLRHRYEALLSKEELDELFKDADPKIVESHSNYIQWQKGVYTWIWIGVLIAVSVFLVLVWCYNLFESSNVLRILRTIIECCTKNM